MRLFQTRLVHEPATKSLFGSLRVEDEPTLLATCDREWLDNLPSHSCVPAGFYRLVPHDGTKYRRTFALVGSTVSHDGSGAGVVRSACVAHWAPSGNLLKGCFAIGAAVSGIPGGRAVLVGKSDGHELLDRLRALDEPHYLSIEDRWG